MWMNEKKGNEEKGKCVETEIDDDVPWLAPVHLFHIYTIQKFGKKEANIGASVWLHNQLIDLVVENERKKSFSFCSSPFFFSFPLRFFTQWLILFVFEREKYSFWSMHKKLNEDEMSMKGISIYVLRGN